MKIKSLEYLSTRILYFVGGIYSLVTILHFGFYYYDLDKFITNLSIGFLIALFGYVIYLNKDLKADFKSLDSQINNHNKGGI